MEQCLISRLGDLQCLPSYLYTCAGNQIWHSWKEPFCAASGPSLVSACHSLSVHLCLYDVVRPASGLMQLCWVDESQVWQTPSAHIHSSEQSSPASRAFKAFTTGSSYWVLCQIHSMKAASSPSNVTASITLNSNTSSVRWSPHCHLPPSDDLPSLIVHPAYPSASLACRSGQSQTWRGTGTIMPGSSLTCGPLGSKTSSYDPCGSQTNFWSEPSRRCLHSSNACMITSISLSWIW